jgi:hypothetical protein
MLKHQFQLLLLVTAYIALTVAPSLHISAQEPSRSDSKSAAILASLPSEWLAAWQDPSVEHRPLQIVHGIPAPRSTRDGMEYYRNLGLGGLVCNVDFRDYMESEAHWETLIRGVKSCADLGMIVWLYDEEGYPSGAAGGLVLQENPDFEAMELAYAPHQDDPFIVRPAYEFTHASNNFHAARRYANLIDDRAVACFVSKTHQAYWKRLKPYFGNTIQAAFTDEPSLIAVNIGPLPEDVRQRVRVIDPVDESASPLPRVPWSYDLAERYEQKYGESLLPKRRSLFSGQSAEDRHVRRQFWALIADLISDRFFGSLQRWCHQHKIASSGHSLWEEQILHHVPLEGNGLKCLARMDIPGLDLLNSDPLAVNYSGWLTAGLPASAAMLEGHRRVMTEVSDFSQKLGGQGPVSVEQMQAVAGWQAAWGVTDFNLYYSPTDRPAESHRAYCDYVGRVNSILAQAERQADVLLYYPIYDLWAEYLPVAEKLTVASQSARAQKLVSSFSKLGQQLQRQQVSFTLVDHEYLAQAKTNKAGALTIGSRDYHAILFPADVELPAAAEKVVSTFANKGGIVWRDNAGEFSRDAILHDSPQRATGLEPATQQIALGRFQRAGHAMLLVVNVSTKQYEGKIRTDRHGWWACLDPADGSQRSLKTSDGYLPLSLAANQSVILITQE